MGAVKTKEDQKDCLQETIGIWWGPSHGCANLKAVSLQKELQHLPESIQRYPIELYADFSTRVGTGTIVVARRGCWAARTRRQEWNFAGASKNSVKKDVLCFGRSTSPSTLMVLALCIRQSHSTKRKRLQCENGARSQKAWRSPPREKRRVAEIPTSWWE